jgi:putative IMPACT (imprinted ancient) family translation regulator
LNFYGTAVLEEKIFPLQLCCTYKRLTHIVAPLGDFYKLESTQYQEATISGTVVLKNRVFQDFSNIFKYVKV